MCLYVCLIVSCIFISEFVCVCDCLLVYFIVMLSVCLFVCVFVGLCPCVVCLLIRV